MSSTVYAPVRTDSNEINVISMLHVAWRYKFLVIAVTLACTLFALYLALTAKLVYRAEAVVTEVSTSGMGNMGGLASRFGGSPGLAGINLSGGGGGGTDPRWPCSIRHLAHGEVRHWQQARSRRAQRRGRQSVWLAGDRFKTKILSINESKEKGDDHDRGPVDRSESRGAVGERLHRARGTKPCGCGRSRIRPATSST